MDVLQAQREGDQRVQARAARGDLTTLTAGLIGGLGPEATIDYYRRLLAGWESRAPGTSPRLIIDSLDTRHMLRLVASDRTALADYVLASADRLARAGADFAVITSNTTHIAFSDVAERSRIPLVSIVEACAERAADLQLKRPGLLGTRFVMGEESLYPRVFRERGIHVVVPDEADWDWIHDRYVNQLVAGIFRDDTRTEFETLIGRLRDRQGVDGIILGGTELPLLLRAPTVAGLPLLDTTGIHVDAVLDRLLRQ